MVFTQNVHPICLPVESNENAEKWKDEEVIVLGFASNDNTYGSLKKAEMSVHTQDKCNDILAEKRKSKNEYFLVVYGGPSKLDTPISSKQSFGLKFSFE